MADNLITQNIPDDCGNGYSYSAVYEVNSYTCANGTYLPAGAIACAQCPTGHTCNGGTFNFSATQTQGLSDGDILTANAIGSCGHENFNQSFSAIYEINTYNCANGTYLPADGIECTSCPTGYTCAGGNYTYNPSNRQGIIANTVTLNFNDDNGNTTTTTCTYDGLVNLPAPPSRVGYDFAGWKVETNNN